MVVVRLRGVVWIVALAVQGIFGNRRGNQTAFAIHEGNANAQGSEVDSSDNSHRIRLL